MSRRHDDGGWAIDNLALSLASARLAGALAVGADTLATGDLSFSATNLDDLSPLVLTKLTGALQAKASASVAEGKQMLSVTANSDRMTIDANRLEGLKVDFKVADLWGAKIVSGFAQLARAEVGGQSITGVKLTADGKRVGQRSRIERERARPRDQRARAAFRRARRRVSNLRASPLRAAASASRSRARRP